MEVGPHINDLLTMLEESSDERRKSVDKLFTHTCESIAILEPWNHATFAFVFRVALVPSNPIIH